MDLGVLWVVHGLLHRDNAMFRKSLEQHRSMQHVPMYRTDRDVRRER
jgi:hypothetical protein